MAHIIACPHVASISPRAREVTLITMKTCLRGILELSQGIWKNKYKRERGTILKQPRQLFNP
jgi:hypothetical protein